MPERMQTTWPGEYDTMTDRDRRRQTMRSDQRVKYPPRAYKEDVASGDRGGGPADDLADEVGLPVLALVLAVPEAEVAGVDEAPGGTTPGRLDEPLEGTADPGDVVEGGVEPGGRLDVDDAADAGAFAAKPSKVSGNIPAATTRDAPIRF